MSVKPQQVVLAETRKSRDDYVGFYKTAKGVSFIRYFASSIDEDECFYVDEVFDTVEFVRAMDALLVEGMTEIHNAHGKIGIALVRSAVPESNYGQLKICFSFDAIRSELLYADWNPQGILDALKA